MAPFPVLHDTLQPAPQAIRVREMLFRIQEARHGLAISRSAANSVVKTTD